MRILSTIARALGIGGLLLTLLAGLVAGTAWAASPQDDVRAANALVQQSLSAARQADLSAARRAYAQYQDRWSEIERGVRGASRPAYVAIEKAMKGVDGAFAASEPN